MSDTHAAAPAVGQASGSPGCGCPASGRDHADLQFILGMIYNLYGTAPTAAKSVGMFSSPVLALHVILFFLLVIAAVGS